VAKYQFMTQEWVDAAKQIREEIEGDVPTPGHSVRLNIVATEVPFGDGEVQAHLDTSGGELVMDLGHLDEADVTVSIDYATLKAMLVDGNPQAGMQAFMAGKIKVLAGDITKLMAMQQAGGAGGELQAEVAEKIKEITE
jgi:putative sterol carrier protein